MTLHSRTNPSLSPSFSHAITLLKTSPTHSRRAPLRLSAAPEDDRGTPTTSPLDRAAQDRSQPAAGRPESPSNSSPIPHSTCGIDNDRSSPSSPPSTSETLLTAILKNRHDEEILSLALPALLSLAADPLLSLVDVAFVGHLNDAPSLAALGLNTPLFAFFFVVFNFLATAVTPAVAKAIVRDDKVTSGKLVWQASALALILGLLMMGGLIAGATPALQLMGLDASDTQLTALSKDYLVYRALAAPAVLFITVGQGTLRGVKDMKAVLKVTTAANVINLVMDPLLIFGLHWGVGGAAMATSMAQYVAAALYGKTLLDRSDQLGLWPPPPLPKDLSALASDMRPFTQAAGAVLARTSALLGVRTVASISASHLGVGAIAAHAIVANLWALFSMVTDSLAVSAQALVAAKIGEGRNAEAKSISERLLQLGFALGLAVATVYFAVQPDIPSWFTQDRVVEDSMASILPLAMGMLPICGLVYVMDGIFVGSEEYSFLAQAMYVSAGATLVTLATVQKFDLGLPGVWIALSTLMVLRGSTLYYGYQTRLPFTRSNEDDASTSNSSASSTPSSSPSSPSSSASSATVLESTEPGVFDSQDVRDIVSQQAREWTALGQAAPAPTSDAAAAAASDDEDDDEGTGTGEGPTSSRNERDLAGHP